MGKVAQQKLHNTLSRSMETFEPMVGKNVNAFVCGQTVYDDAHLGHAKSYINFDVVVRWLRKEGYSVTYIQNITDIDDKIIERAKEQGMTPEVLARRFEERFLEDMERIGVRKNVGEYPRSHDYVDEMRMQIQLLLERGYAYVIGNDVYFEVDKFKDYTLLSGMKLSELEKHRIDLNDKKRKPYDFALWKGAKPGEPSWKIKLNQKGKDIELDGRPGWHIEDTAITHAFFGEQYDLHGGARELIFPHHTNEIAQSEAAFGKKPFVKYWIHSGVLSIKGVKMSKSLKNFIRIRDFLEKESPETLRMLICSTHYRKDIEYTEELVGSARKRLGYISSSFSIFYNISIGSGGEEARTIADLTWEEFSAAMNDDFNTPLALTRLVEAVQQLRRIGESGAKISKENKEYAASKILGMFGVLGLLEDGGYKKELPKDAGKLVAERERLRKEKKFDEADKVRKTLSEKYGIILEDSEYGPVWYRSG